MRPTAFSAACARHGRAPPRAPPMSRNSSLSSSCSTPGEGVIFDTAAVHVSSQKHVQHQSWHHGHLAMRVCCC